LFRPPKNEEEFALWEKAIPQRDRRLDKNSRVCALHFKDEEIIRQKVIGEGFAQVNVS